MSVPSLFGIFVGLSESDDVETRRQCGTIRIISDLDASNGDPLASNAIKNLVTTCRSIKVCECEDTGRCI